MIRHAVILAAGRGARLDRPGTPKPLVDVGGTSIIVRLIRQLQSIDIQQIQVVVGYESPKIIRALAGHPDLTAKLFFVENLQWEKGVASSVIAATEQLQEPFLLSMGDHIFSTEIIEQMSTQLPIPGHVSMLIDPQVEQVFSFESAVKVKMERGYVVEIGRNLTTADGIDTGLMIADPSLAAQLQISLKNGLSELFDGLGQVAAQRKLRAIPLRRGYWYDVDTPQDMIYAEMRVRRHSREQAAVVVPKQKSPTDSEEFRFGGVRQEPTRMVVGRGFLRQPASFELIPPSSASSPIFVFTDETVNELYGRNLINELKQNGYDAQGIVLPDGEQSKSLSNYIYLVERILSYGVDERTVFISVGGGMVCNVCGFIASTIYRGLRLIHLPTSLMAQCDAAISHKQAINGHRGKNLIGSYFNPALVAVDVTALETLDDRLMRDGMAEVIKHALGQDREYAELLLAYDGNLRDLDFLEACIKRNVQLKCELSAMDPKEYREAMVLQYGHTVGHPVEHLSGYSFYHGESVAIGMMVAARVARALGACDDSVVANHERLLRKFGLPTKIPKNIHSSDIMAALKYNKRYLTEGTHMALVCEIGRLWSVDNDFVIPVPDSVLVSAIEKTTEK